MGDPGAIGAAGLVLTRDGAVCHCSTPGADGAAPEPRRLLTLADGASELGVSPDESTLSFIVAGDLWLCRLTAASDGSLSAASPRQVPQNIADLFDAIDENGNQQLEYAELVCLPPTRPGPRLTAQHTLVAPAGELVAPARNLQESWRPVVCISKII